MLSAAITIDSMAAWNRFISAKKRRRSDTLAPAM